MRGYGISQPLADVRFRPKSDHYSRVRWYPLEWVAGQMSAMESIAQQQEELEKFFKERDAILKNNGEARQRVSCTAFKTSQTRDKFHVQIVDRP
jgi:hypothetical protein